MKPSEAFLRLSADQGRRIAVKWNQISMIQSAPGGAKLWMIGREDPVWVIESYEDVEARDPPVTSD